jgi:2-dehydropantoate 2-reductase
MKGVMKILIYGSGAIGSNLGGLLTKSGEDVTLLARGTQLDALKKNGLTIERDGHPPEVIAVKAVQPEEIIEQFDIIFVTLKSMQIEDAAENMMSYLAADGALVMIQNGLPWWYFEGVSLPRKNLKLKCLDPSGRLNKLIPLGCVIGAVIFKPVLQVAPGRILISETVAPKLVIGELDNKTTKRVQKISEIVNRAGLQTFISNDIRLDKWRKLMINLIWNPICAITQSSPGHVASSPYASNLVRTLIAEANSVLANLGIELEIDPEVELERVRNNFSQQPSMLQDVRAGRPIECDAIVNSVIEVAEIFSVPVPSLRVIAGLLDVINQSLMREKKAIQLVPV